MKKIYKIAMLLAAVALNACTIDIIGPDGPGRDIDTPRTIAVSFAPQTKSALSKEDGITPEFQSGDEILVSNGRKYDTRPIEFDHNGGASFTTDLTGDLIAVYPAKAAKLDGTEITGVLVPSNQTGRFADANIAMAKIKDGVSKAYFENQTAVLKFYVDESIGVTGIGIFSIDERIADGFIDEKGTVIEQGTEDEKEVNYTTRITVQQIADPEANYYQPNYIPLWQLTDDPQMRVCYVAIRPTAGSDTYSLKVSSRTTTQTVNNGLLQKNQLVGGMVQRVFENVSLPANTLANVFIPYYIPVNVGTDMEPEYQYWSYCNLGAFLPEEPGHYFTWGNTYGYVPKNYEEDEDDVEWLLPSGKPAPSGGFTNDNYTKTQGSKLTGNITAENDAATVALGGKWRIPTKSEFEALRALKPSWGSYREGPQYGCFAGDIFFPAVGSGCDYNISYMNDKGSYWSSTLSEDDSSYAEYLDFSDNYFQTEDFYRYHGRPIRPIYAPTPGSTVDDLNVLPEDSGKWQK